MDDVLCVAGLAGLVGELEAAGIRVCGGDEPAQGVLEGIAAGAARFLIADRADADAATAALAGPVVAGNPEARVIVLDADGGPFASLEGAGVRHVPAGTEVALDAALRLLGVEAAALAGRTVLAGAASEPEHEPASTRNANEPAGFAAHEDDPLGGFAAHEDDPLGGFAAHEDNPLGGFAAHEQAAQRRAQTTREANPVAAQPAWPAMDADEPYDVPVYHDEPHETAAYQPPRDPKPEPEPDAFETAAYQPPRDPKPEPDAFETAAYQPPRPREPYPTTPEPPNTPTNTPTSLSNATKHQTPPTPQENTPKPHTGPTTLNLTPQATRRILIVTGAKGGILKTTTSLALAQRAAHAGLRTILIDANRGQADIATLLRLPIGTPTIYDWATGADWNTILLTPSRTTPDRPGADRPAFALIAGPAPGTSSRNIVTEQAYADAIAKAAAEADLVIVDTQIAEDTDTSGMYDNLLIPLAQTGAWILALTETKDASLRNIVNRLKQWNGPHRIDRTQILIGLTKADKETGPALAARFREAAARYGTLAGIAWADKDAEAAQGAGSLLDTHPALDPLVGPVLQYIAGIPHTPQPHKPARPRRRLFPRKRP